MKALTAATLGLGLLGFAAAPALADCSAGHVSASIKKPIVTTDSSTITTVDEKKS